MTMDARLTQEQEAGALKAAEHIVGRIHEGGKLVWHTCSMCQYPCGFFIGDNGEIRYDNGCDCTRTYKTREASFDDIRDHFRSNPHLIEKALKDEPWGSNGMTGTLVSR